MATPIPVIPACCAAAIANLTIIKREGLVERVRDHIGPYFQKRWTALADHPMVGEARMVGMFGALELVPDENDLKKRFDNVGKVGTITRDHSFSNGLVMRAVRDSLIISPPLTIYRGRGRCAHRISQEDTRCGLGRCAQAGSRLRRSALTFPLKLNAGLSSPAFRV